MYEFYQLNQAWQKMCVKQLEPMFNNPMADWYMNLWIEASLRAWFWPGAVIELEDQIKDLAQTFSICK